MELLTVFRVFLHVVGYTTQKLSPSCSALAKTEMSGSMTCHRKYWTLYYYFSGFSKTHLQFLPFRKFLQIIMGFWVIGLKKGAGYSLREKLSRSRLAQGGSFLPAMQPGSCSSGNCTERWQLMMYDEIKERNYNFFLFF